MLETSTHLLHCWGGGSGWGQGVDGGNNPLPAYLFSSSSLTWSQLAPYSLVHTWYISGGWYQALLTDGGWSRSSVLFLHHVNSKLASPPKFTSMCNPTRTSWNEFQKLLSVMGPKEPVSEDSQMASPHGHSSYDSHDIFYNGKARIIVFSTGISSRS